MLLAAGYTPSLYLPQLVIGSGMTLALTTCSISVGLIFGLIAALGKISFKPLARVPASGYVWIIRGTPLLVQIWLVWFGLPQIGLDLARIMQVDTARFITAIFVLGLNSGAYIAEIVRAAIQSIDRGQMEAARSLGMSHRQAMQRVILPQAYRRMLPPLGNEFIAMLKDSALVSTIAVTDLMRRAQLLSSATFKPILFFSLAALMYLIMTTIFTQLVSVLEKRLEVYE